MHPNTQLHRSTVLPAPLGTMLHKQCAYGNGHMKRSGHRQPQRQGVDDSAKRAMPAAARAAARPGLACNNGQTTLQTAQHSTQHPDIAMLSEQLSRLTEQVLEQERTIASLEEQIASAQPKPPARLSVMSAFEAQRMLGNMHTDRRTNGGYDARYHSIAQGATPKDYRVLPDRIFLVRHAESEGNVDSKSYSHIPDSQVMLTERGKKQARVAGQKIKDFIERTEGPDSYKLFFYTSPYKRSLQTCEHIRSAFSPHHIMGVQEEVQLREQDFGNFQDPEGKRREKADRLRFGRFYYRFPDGESGADVYDRLTIFEDHLIRDINAGRFAGSTNLVLVTHGLALRIFLMRWFHWTVDQFLSVFNPENAEPLVLERVTSEQDSQADGPVAWVHTKALYRLAPESMQVLRGVTQDMCLTGNSPRAVAREQDPFAVEPGLATMSSVDEVEIDPGLVDWQDPCAMHSVPGICDASDDLEPPAAKPTSSPSVEGVLASLQPSRN